MDFDEKYYSFNIRILETKIENLNHENSCNITVLESTIESWKLDVDNSNSLLIKNYKSNENNVDEYSSNNRIGNTGNQFFHFWKNIKIAFYDKFSPSAGGNFEFSEIFKQQRFFIDWE